MIAAKRLNKTEILDVLAKVDRNGLSEKEKAIGHFTKGDPAKKPTFKVYKEEKVKNELNRMFNHKCAYCESSYEHVAPMDVEHFRPKGAYIMPNGKKSQFGYYWLAAEWINLLPSCIDCNRERGQVRRKSDGKIIKSKSGKANKFPLLDESKRAKASGEEKNETPLLLNPALDKPTQHLEFMDDGTVRPKNSAKEKNTMKGQHSIEVFGLDRNALLNERNNIMTRLKSQMQNVCSNTLNVREFPNHARFPSDLARAENELKNFAAKDAIYLALVKPMIRIFKRTLKDSKEYLNLKIQLGNNPNDPVIQNALEQILKRIKRRTGEQKPASNLVKSIVVWMGLLD